MSNKTILFADDSATMRTIMEKTFLAEPFDVFAVPSGEAAIMKARDLVPDVIIADAGMAGVSGYDVCKVIRDDVNLSKTPFIIMAGVTHPYDETRAKEVGVDHYVKKPFDSGQLIDKVTELVGIADGDAAQEIPQKLEADETTQTKPISRPLTEKPVVAPTGPRPIATPIAEPPSKNTLEFGRISTAQKPEPRPVAAARPASDQTALKKPEEESASYQVGTLAELAQMDDKGAHVPQATSNDAIELPGSDNIPVIPSAPSKQNQGGEQKKRASAQSLPIVNAVRERARVAAKEVEEKVDNLDTQQLEAIRSLTQDVVERVVWEIVPDLAEAIIKEELAKLLEE